MRIASSPEAKAVADKLASIGISESYAWQIANGKRTPSMSMALRIYRDAQIKLGPLAAATKRDIDVLERLTSDAA